MFNQENTDLLSEKVVSMILEEVLNIRKQENGDSYLQSIEFKNHLKEKTKMILSSTNQMSTQEEKLRSWLDAHKNNPENKILVDEDSDLEVKKR